MKKFICLFVFLFSGAAQGMYDQGGKLEYDTVKLTNKASIPLEIVWMEYDRSPEGRPVEIKKTIEPGRTITVKIGEVGGYLRGGRSTKVIYNPIPGNESFQQQFLIDLPTAPAFAFTAVKLAKILDNIWVPGVFKADEKGDFSSFQYMNMQHPSQWEEAMKNAGGITTIK